MGTLYPPLWDDEPTLKGKKSAEVLNLKVHSQVVKSRATHHKIFDENKTLPQPKSLVPSLSESKAPSMVNANTGSDLVGKENALALYKAELRALIDKNKSYPPLSKRLGQTGIVVVAFTLLKDGHIIDVRLVKPSRYERLNFSALEAVKKVEKFKPIPQEIGELKMDIKVPVKFVTI